MDNQQLQNLSNEQLQVLLTGKFGDGHLSTPRNLNSNSLYTSNCIYRDYLEYKKRLLGDIAGDIHYKEYNGYAQKPIYTLLTKTLPEITFLRNLNIESALELMDELGIALWIYDDGSLHKDKLFYNLNTHSFSKEINEDLFIPFLKKYSINATLTSELKKDGRKFWYLRVNKFEGAFEVSQILQKYYVECYNYKIWSSETIQKWSKLQEQLKSTDNSISNRKKGRLLRNIEL